LLLAMLASIMVAIPRHRL